MKTIINENDEQYLEIVEHILNNKKFNDLDHYFHHGTSRLLHSQRVSYYSYKVAKKLGLDYETTAIAGLLHDFYGETKGTSKLHHLYEEYSHPLKAAKNAETYFKVSPKIKNIIATHMFPWTLRPTKYIEGWIVNMVDKTVATYEYSLKFRYKFSLWTIFLFNILRIGTTK
ncbi:MAG: HD domain-containing protein [Bacilli bacterium]|nr:HD domain-containing protein [Bacilli bacterium]